MQLNRLCFILPTDSDDIEPATRRITHTHDEMDKEKPPSRSCNHQLVSLVRQFMNRLYESGWIRFRNPAKKQQSGVFFDMDGVEISSRKVGKENPRIFSYSELYIGSKGFSEEEILGSGGFGKVYKAVLPSDGSVVAVKCLAEKGERFERTFAAELVAVAHLRHRNLVRLRGWCVHDDRLLLVYDYMTNRSLDRVLFRRLDNPSPSATLGWEKRKNIVGGLAAALNYLHGQLETQIIHRDVKTSNVMLDSQFNARLGDFGLARWMEHELEYHQTATNSRTTSRSSYQQFHLADTTKMGGTIGYLPPESFQRRSFATAKSDVFSFGIVVLEVASGRRAVDISYPEEKMVLLDWVRRLSDQRKLLEAADTRLPDGSYGLFDMERAIHLGLLCTLHNPQSRPTMKWVVEALSGDVSSKLPSLPSFRSQPLYISLSSSSDTSRSNTATDCSADPSTATSSNSAASYYVSACAETIYETVEREIKCDDDSSAGGHLPRRINTNNFVVETPREISYRELVSATDNFSDSRRVAELDFGTAYHGFLDNDRHILVKRLGMTKCPALVARFSDELHNLGRLRHRNLVQLRGWCTERGEMLVVYDYSTNRLLSHCLFDRISREKGCGRPLLRWRQRYNIIKSLASAILYLHEEWDEQVIHRNITSSAIILDPDMNPRLSSFALAEFLTRNDHAHHAASETSDKSVRGIFGYLAPEYVESGEATPMTDIYSFGVVVLEVITGQMAVDFCRPEALLVRRVCELEARKKTLTELVDIRLNEEYDLLQLKRLVELGIACTRSDPMMRPNIRQILSILDGNDKRLAMVQGESIDQWKQRNEAALSLVRSMQALGIQ